MVKQEIAATALRRFGETLLSCSLVSALLMLIHKGTYLKDTAAVNWTVALLGLLAFTAVNVFLLRRCRFVLGRDRRTFIVTNGIAWLAFTAVHLTALLAAGKDGAIYQYAFQVAKIGEMLNIKAISAAIVFDIFVLALIPLSQLGMKRILQEAEEEISARYD